MDYFGKEVWRVKKGRLCLSLVLAGLLVCGVAFIGTAAEEQEVEDVIMIKSDLWDKHTKPAVKLTHKKHAEDHGVACKECHHVFEDGKNVWEEGDHVQKCQECHTEPTIRGEKRLPEAQQKLNLKLAFHNNCGGCHKTLKRENPDTTAPVTCNECHAEEK
jgi:hypothetical protein